MKNFVAAVSLVFATATLLNFCHCEGSPPLAIYGNVSYGSHPEQVMDVYLPEGRNATSTKVVVLIHGGGWSSGTKESMNGWVYYFYYYILPVGKYAIVNMGYRLGRSSTQSPGFPKQLQDISAVLQYIKSKASDYQIKPEFALVGASAGAHLSMLYGYGYNSMGEVKLIGNLVGPASLTDPAYTKNPAYDPLFKPLVGNFTYAQNSTIYESASPDTYITAKSPKTISFYGDADYLIPPSQGKILEDKLDAVGVYNKFYLYPGGGHLVFTEEQNAHMYKKMRYFFNNYF